jgi:acyl carrier protein
VTRDVVHGIVAEALELPMAEVHPSAGRGSVAGWDSLAMVKIVLALEEQFSIELSGDDVMRMRSVDDIVAVIDERRQGPPATI